MESVDVRLLGRFAVAVDGVPLRAEAFAQRRAADLVKVLALAPGHRLPRDAVVEALWPHLGAEAGLANLHKAAHHARRALGAPEAVVLRRGMVELAPQAAVTTDVERFEAGDDDAHGGDLLPEDAYETWTLHARERLRDRRLALLRRQGRWAEVLAQDPTDEEAHRALMRKHAARADAVAVARQLRALRDALAEVGLLPSAETLALHRELCAGPAVQARPRHRGPLFGRDEEMAVASRALAEAGDGRGGALLLTGDPGVGKTRLADAIAAAAAQRGRHVLRAAAREPGGRSPYRPLAEALEPLMAGRPDLVAALGRPAQRVLGLLAPLGATRDGGTASGREVVAAVGHLLAAAAQEHGVVLVLEDLHEADEATVGALHYLVAAARGERTLIVGSARPDEGGEAVAALRRRLVEQRAMAEVVLRPLPPEPLRRLIARSAAHPLPADTVDAIVAMSAGNPLFAEELAAVAGPSAAPSLPDRLRTVLDARLERLEAVVARRVLDALAVLDDGCTTEEVAEVAAADPAEVEPGLEAGVRTGALTRAAGGWGFRHPLLRDAARRRVAPARLAEGHRAVAACLERRGAAPERVAAHLLDGDRAREAVPWLRAAAARAAEVGALADGARWVELALRHADPAALAELLELLGDLRHGMGDQRAPGAYGRARAVAPADALARLAVKQARAHLALGDLAAARAAIAAAGDPQGHERDALLVRGMIAWYGGDFAAARGLAAEAARHPPRGDGHDTAVSLEAMSAHAEGRWERAMEARLAEAWHVPRLVGRVVDAYLCVTEYVLHAGDPADVLTRFARELHEQAAAAGAERGRAFAATVLGEAQLLAGEPEAALGHLAEAVRLSRRVGAVGGESLARLRLAEALMALGRPLEGRAQLEEALDLAHASPLADHLLFLVHAPLVRWAASPGEAMAVLDRSEALLGAQASCRFCPVEYHVAAAIACARAGETDRGHRFLLRAEDAVALWTGGPRWASLAEARGELLRAEEREEEAQIAFLRAVDGYAAAGHRAHEQRVRGLLGAPA